MPEDSNSEPLIDGSGSGECKNNKPVQTACSIHSYKQGAGLYILFILTTK
jgi:hypothetical protein